MKKNREIKWKNGLLIGLLIILFVTGVLIRPEEGLPVMLIAHKLAAILFAIGIIIHVIRHR